ncbi:putative Secreted protein [Azospirillaceae bacterium]
MGHWGMKNRAASSLRVRVFAAIIGVVVLLSGGVASAADFTLYNDARPAVVGFYIKSSNGSYSDNWLRQPLRGGQSTGMNFKSNSGDCRRVMRVETEDGNSFEYTHDFCNNRGIHVRSDKVTYTPQ